jgi:heme/copper-type cytochrome/quinol oxidase subunit 2
MVNFLKFFGIWHGFMSIVVEAVSAPGFLVWIATHSAS